MNTSASGAGYERAYRHQLELDGYVVVRSAASKGPFDLVAWYPFYGRDGIPILFIQLKKGRISCRASKVLADSLRTSYVDGYGFDVVRTATVHKRKDVLFCHHYG